MREYLGIDGALPHVELLHLMGGAGSPDGAAFGCMAGPLPRGGAVHMIHVENTAVTVYTCLPVCASQKEVHQHINTYVQTE